MSNSAITVLEIIGLFGLAAISFGFILVLSKNLPEYNLPIPFKIRISVSLYVGYLLISLILAILLVLDILDPNRNWNIRILSMFICVGSPFVLIAVIGTFLNLSFIGKLLSLLKIYPTKGK